MKKTKYDENYQMLINYRKDINDYRVNICLLEVKTNFILSVMIFFFAILFEKKLSFLFSGISLMAIFMCLYFSKLAHTKAIENTDEDIRNLKNKDFELDVSEVKKLNKMIEIFEHINLFALFLSIAFLAK